VKSFNIPALVRVMAIVALGLTAGACATVVGGTTQDVLVESEPAGAECRLDRLGASVAIVKPTPGRVNVSRSKETIAVNCKLDGYGDSNETLSSSFTGATVGNILLGGFIGVAIDAASGANNQYPERITVILTPASFANAAARDAHFDRLTARIQETAGEELKRIKGKCSSTNTELCRMEEAPVVESRDRALADIERKRQAARIAATS
jgi:hypothetical protein